MAKQSTGPGPYSCTSYQLMEKGVVIGTLQVSGKELEWITLLLNNAYLKGRMDSLQEFRTSLKAIV